LRTVAQEIWTVVVAFADGPPGEVEGSSTSLSALLPLPGEMGAPGMVCYRPSFMKPLTEGVSA